MFQIWAFVARCVAHRLIRLRGFSDAEGSWAQTIAGVQYRRRSMKGGPTKMFQIWALEGHSTWRVIRLRGLLGSDDCRASVPETLGERRTDKDVSDLGRRRPETQKQPQSCAHRPDTGYGFRVRGLSLRRVSNEERGGGEKERCGELRGF